MANGIRRTPEEGRRTYRSKRCGNSNKDEDNIIKITKLCLRNLDSWLNCTHAKLNYLKFCIKMDLALNNIQRLICHKNQTTNQSMLLLLYIDSFVPLSWFLFCLGDKDSITSTTSFADPRPAPKRDVLNMILCTWW